MIKLMTGLGACVLAATLAGGCANTVKGAEKDTEKVVEKTAAATQTVDVKSALIADGRVDASNINVDTNHETMTVVLKGHVPNASMKGKAGRIAAQEAPNYKIDNQLVIKP